MNEGIDMLEIAGAIWPDPRSFSYLD